MINQAKPTTSIANTTQPDRGITWATIDTTFATETHTWALVSTLFDNTTKPSTSLTNQAKP
jgi:hypothetical protein